MDNIKAFILAAGKGERMKNLTIDTPKTLVKIGQITILESIVKFLHDMSIMDIYVITGYQKEKFESKNLKRYNLKYIYNQDYSKANNISSLYFARDFLDRMLIIEGDIFFDNNINFRLPTDSKYSFYLTGGVENSREWIVNFDKFINSVQKEGGTGQRIFGVSYWTKQDAIKIKKLITEEYENNNLGIYWDEIVLDLYLDQFKIKTLQIPNDFLIEVDTEREHSILIENMEKKNEII